MVYFPSEVSFSHKYPTCFKCLSHIFSSWSSIYLIVFCIYGTKLYLPYMTGPLLLPGMVHRLVHRLPPSYSLCFVQTCQPRHRGLVLQGEGGIITPGTPEYKKLPLHWNEKNGHNDTRHRLSQNFHQLNILSNLYNPSHASIRVKKSIPNFV